MSKIGCDCINELVVRKIITATSGGNGIQWFMRNPQNRIIPLIEIFHCPICGKKLEGDIE